MTTGVLDKPRTQTQGATASRAWREVSVNEAAGMLRAGRATLVDVREADEHARERIEGAMLAPLSRFDAGVALRGLYAGHTLVLHCRSGKRSAQAAAMAAGVAPAGVEVVSMAGGIEAWKGAGLAVRVNTGVSRVSIMRQVQLVVGVSVLAGSALAWWVHPALVAIPAFFGAGLTFAGATGTCALASVLGRMPWNRAAGAGPGPGAGAGASGGACGLK